MATLTCVQACISLPSVPPFPVHVLLLPLEQKEIQVDPRSLQMFFVSRNPSYVNLVLFQVIRKQ